MKLNRRYIYIILAAVFFGLFLFYGFCRVNPVRVETAPVTRADFRTTIDAEGRTRYHDRYTVTAPISGKMSRIELHEGDRVPIGFVITRIDPAPPRPVSPGQESQPNVNPSAYVVYAPVAGRLSRIFDASERMIEVGTPIVEISKPSKMEIAVDVLSAEATLIKPGMDVVIANWGGEGELQAKVRTVEPKAFTKVSSLGVEEQRVNIIADFVNVPAGLGDNYRVDTRIILWEGKDVLQVPSSALFRHGEKWAVYVVESGRARLRQIETGHRSQSFVEILQGVKENEIVILHPPNQIAEGAAVEIQ